MFDFSFVFTGILLLKPYFVALLSRYRFSLLPGALSAPRDFHVGGAGKPQAVTLLG